MRNPFEAHLCARGPEAAAEWEAGFNAAKHWMLWLAKPGEAEAIHLAVVNSDGGLDWKSLGWPDDSPWLEGFALGVYGRVQRCRLT